MKNLQYPISLVFKISTFTNDFIAKDATDNTFAFVSQKLLRLVEHVDVFSDETKTQKIFQINANKWIDFSACYVFTDGAGAELGRVARKGWASMFKAHYEIFDEKQAQDLVIREENAWVKVADGVLSQVPILNFFTGYLFNPAYVVTRPDGTLVARLKKDASFFGRKFTIQQVADFEHGEESRILLSLMMMILLERRRG
jgi:hypothetical protein